jgi:hypothetical protein
MAAGEESCRCEGTRFVVARAHNCLVLNGFASNYKPCELFEEVFFKAPVNRGQSGCLLLLRNVSNQVASKMLVVMQAPVTNISGYDETQIKNAASAPLRIHLRLDQRDVLQLGVSLPPGCSIWGGNCEQNAHLQSYNHTQGCEWGWRTYLFQLFDNFFDRVFGFFPPLLMVLHREKMLVTDQEPSSVPFHVVLQTLHFHGWYLQLVHVVLAHGEILRTCELCYFKT